MITMENGEQIERQSRMLQDEVRQHNFTKALLFQSQKARQGWEHASQEAFAQLRSALARLAILEARLCHLHQERERLNRRLANMVNLTLYSCIHIQTNPE